MEEVDKLEYFLKGSGMQRPSETVSYNHWLKELRKVSLKKRTRRGDVTAVFRYT